PANCQKACTERYKAIVSRESKTRKTFLQIFQFFLDSWFSASVENPKHTQKACQNQLFRLWQTTSLPVTFLFLFGRSLLRRRDASLSLPPTRNPPAPGAPAPGPVRSEPPQVPPGALLRKQELFPGQ